LRCPANPRHASFRGSQQVCFDSTVDLDATGAVLHRTLGPRLYDISEPRDREIQCGVCGATAWRPRRSLSFVPAEATVLLCDFSTGFRPPEMIKMRPVVVLSPSTRNHQTCTVIPLSTVEPRRSTALIVQIDAEKYPFLNGSTWAKCDMTTTISRTRLFLLRDPADGKGIDSRMTTVDGTDLAAIRRATAAALGLGLTR
jgi:mRNA interferase MazF